MRIAISTLIGYFNYGNRLQNYALQEILKDMGNEVYTIRDYTNVVEQESFFYRLKESLLSGTFFEKISKKANFKKRRADNRLNIVRENEFKDFTEQHIRETDFFINQDTVDYSFDDEFDCYVIGSDQVWNYGFPNFSNNNFVSYSKKPKVSYAASFGVSDIPDRLKEQYRKGLKEIDFISVREDAGAKLVKNITGRNSAVVLDPTLLLERKQWEKLISDNVAYNEKYIIVYFLGILSDDDRAYIRKFAKRNSYKIKDLYSIKSPDLWVSDPSEFVNLISQAQAVFTDSFHGSVFSIIFEKYFEVFSRKGNAKSMDSRIDTLLGDLDLLDRWHDVKNFGKRPNYSNSIKKLKDRRMESLSFLSNSLNSVENRIGNES